MATCAGARSSRKVSTKGGAKGAARVVATHGGEQNNGSITGGPMARNSQPYPLLWGAIRAGNGKAPAKMDILAAGHSAPPPPPPLPVGPSNPSDLPTRYLPAIN